MAEWVYQVKRVTSITDSQFEPFLRTEGESGWELVQLIALEEDREEKVYNVIFKREKSLIAMANNLQK